MPDRSNDLTMDDLLDDVTQAEEEVEPEQRLNVDIPKSLHSDFKAACARQDQTMKDAIVRFIEAYVARHL
jgi:hypothetical protein